MRVIVFGGDGFCGWPTTLGLSAAGHDVMVVDNLSRRAIDHELSAESLTPLATVDQRLNRWKRVSGRVLQFKNINLATQFAELQHLLKEWRPDAVVHFAEQRAAPYSMKSSAHKRYTVDNNVASTHNLLAALAEVSPQTHLVHLGTMGVYGYSTTGATLPEGYLTVKVPVGNDGWVEQGILYPTNPGSVYHMTKTLDQLMFAFYNKNDKLQVTDLHQGIVWGTNTAETSIHEELINRFDYDGDYGTVLNRFLMQGAIGHPLTVHGSGGQTRAFIHIRDTVQCVRLAIENPPVEKHRVRIMNQLTETHRVRDLAELVSRMTGTEVAYLGNPRNEAAENDLAAENKCFLDLGLKPTTLSDGLMNEVTEIARKYAHRCVREKILCRSYWNTEAAERCLADEVSKKVAAA
jgi:UDP-sulfoquinovose synthase